MLGLGVLSPCDGGGNGEEEGRRQCKETTGSRLRLRSFGAPLLLEEVDGRHKIAPGEQQQEEGCCSMLTGSNTMIRNRAKALAHERVATTPMKPTIQ